MRITCVPAIRRYKAIWSDKRQIETAREPSPRSRDHHGYPEHTTDPKRLR